VWQQIHEEGCNLSPRRDRLALLSVREQLLYVNPQNRALVVVELRRRGRVGKPYLVRMLLRELYKDEADYKQVRQ
jgi:hypothetical protein